MANTVTFSGVVNWANGTTAGGSISASSSNSVTQSGSTAAVNVQAIGTTTEALVVAADSVMPGYLFLKNLDATNFVNIDLNTPVVAGSTAFCKLRAGEWAFIPTSRTTIYALADTATVNLQIVAIPL
jgi:hypothetical protein